MLNPRLPHTNPSLRMQAGLFKKEQLSVTCERIGTSNWLIASRMASAVASLWLSSRPDINSSVYSGINYKKKKMKKINITRCSF